VYNTEKSHTDEKLCIFLTGGAYAPYATCTAAPLPPACLLKLTPVYYNRARREVSGGQRGRAEALEGELPLCAQLASGRARSDGSVSDARPRPVQGLRAARRRHRAPRRLEKCVSSCQINREYDLSTTVDKPQPSYDLLTQQQRPFNGL